MEPRPWARSIERLDIQPSPTLKARTIGRLYAQPAGRHIDHPRLRLLSIDAEPRAFRVEAYPARASVAIAPLCFVDDSRPLELERSRLRLPATGSREEVGAPAELEVEKDLIATPGLEMLGVEKQRLFGEANDTCRLTLAEAVGRSGEHDLLALNSRQQAPDLARVRQTSGMKPA
jgi:hypothetical protein